LLPSEVPGGFLALVNVGRRGVIEAQHEMDMADLERGIVALPALEAANRGQARGLCLLNVLGKVLSNSLAAGSPAG
jgi:hypothetical protein